MREKARWVARNGDSAVLVEWPDSDRLSVTAEPSMTSDLDARVTVGIDIQERIRLLPEMHNSDHDAPFAAFTQAMADELRANAEKGDRATWMEERPRDLLAEIQHHLVKLWAVTVELDRERWNPGAARVLPWVDPVIWQHTTRIERINKLKSLVKEFAADVANISMMVADNMDAL